eukprot:2598632-Lingulodinium_polyedra.AAC.1
MAGRRSPLSPFPPPSFSGGCVSPPPTSEGEFKAHPGGDELCRAGPVQDCAIEHRTVLVGRL